MIVFFEALFSLDLDVEARENCEAGDEAANDMGDDYLRVVITEA